MSAPWCSAMSGDTTSMPQPRSFQAIGIECTAVVTDIADPASVEELVRKSSDFSNITAVVHTAGVSPSMGAAEHIMRIDAGGADNVNEAFLPLVEQRFV